MLLREQITDINYLNLYSEEVLAKAINILIQILIKLYQNIELFFKRKVLLIDINNHCDICYPKQKN